MEKSLEKKMIGLLKENMTSVEVGAIQSVLEDSAKLAQLVETKDADILHLEEAKEALTKTNTRLSEELKDLKEELSHLKSLASREEDIIIRENQQAVFEANLHVEKAQAVANTYRTCFETVFKNPIVRKQIQGTTGNPPVKDSNGFVQYPDVKNITEEITEE